MVHIYQCGHGVYVLVQGIRVAAGAGEGSEVYVVGAQKVYGHWDERARLGHLLVLAVRLMHFYLSAQPEQTVS